MHELKNIFLFSVIFLVFLCSSCVAPRMVRPLEKGQKAFRVDAGYFIEDSISSRKNNKFLLAITFAKGIDEKSTGFFTLRANYFLWPILEGGFLHAFTKPKGLHPGFSTSIVGSIMPVYDGRGFGIAPLFQTAPNLYWEFSEKKHFLYFGANIWLWPGYGNFLKFTPQIGSTLNINKYEINIEIKYIPVRTEILFENPASGVLLGITRKF